MDKLIGTKIDGFMGLTADQRRFVLDGLFHKGAVYDITYSYSKVGRCTIMRMKPAMKTVATAFNPP